MTQVTARMRIDGFERCDSPTRSQFRPLRKKAQGLIALCQFDFIKSWNSSFSVLEQELLRVQDGPADVFQSETPLICRDAGDVILSRLHLS